MPIAQAWEVVVTREPEWSDGDRNRLLELAHYETGICRCGYHESLTGDDSLTFMPSDRHCPVCAGQAQWNRKQEADDERAAKTAEKATPFAPRPTDGRFTYMRMLSPTEVASLAQPGLAKQAVGEHPEANQADDEKH